MPRAPTSNPKQFVQGCPVLHVPDVVVAATFFRDVLGFQWDFGDDAYAVVWRDNSAVHLCRGSALPIGVHLFQWLQDVDAYHAEIVPRGANVTVPLQDTPYGLREFAVQTPTGVSIVFGQDIHRDGNEDLSRSQATT